MRFIKYYDFSINPAYCTPHGMTFDSTGRVVLLDVKYRYCVVCFAEKGFEERVGEALYFCKECSKHSKDKGDMELMRKYHANSLHHGVGTLLSVLKKDPCIQPYIIISFSPTSTAILKKTHDEYLIVRNYE